MCYNPKYIHSVQRKTLRQTIYIGKPFIAHAVNLSAADGLLQEWIAIVNRL